MEQHYKYKVVKAGVNDAQDVMNEYAQKGWRVITVSPNIAMGYGVVITFEKEIK